MKVHYSYLNKQFANPKKIFKALEKVVKEGDFTLGKRVEAFEEKFAKHAGTKYAVGVSSGTEALSLSLQSLGVDHGEVITPVNSFWATPNAIWAAGARPVFVDVLADYTANPYLIEEAVNINTTAIMPVHLTGRPADMLAIMDIAKKYDLPVVEDAAQAIGAKINGIHVGNFGNSAGFSFHPLKNLNVWGDAGMIVTNDKNMYEVLCELRNQGMKDRDTWNRFGQNMRIATLQAEIGNQVIGNAESITEQRIENAAFYDRALQEISEITLPPRDEHIRQVYHTYVIKTNRRDDLEKHLISGGIEAKIHYRVPLHLQPATKVLHYKKGQFPIAEAQAKQIITLPVHEHLTKKQKEYVVKKVREFYH